MRTCLLSRIGLVVGLWAVPLAAEQLSPQRAEFTTADGVTIVGDYYAPTGRAVVPPAILLPMYRHDRSSWKPLIEPLHAAGLAVLAIDLRGHGESVKPAELDLVRRVEQRDPKLFADMHQDVAAAVQWVRQQPNVAADKAVLIGASVGCSVALDYAGRDQTVRAVVCLTPGTDYLGLDSTAHVRKIGAVPALLLATADERQAAEELAKLAPGAKAEIVGPGKVHGTQMLGKIPDIATRITKFINTALNAADEADKQQEKPARQPDRPAKSENTDKH